MIKKQNVLNGNIIGDKDNISRTDVHITNIEGACQRPLFLTVLHKSR